MQVLNALTSTDEAKVLNALKEARSKGDIRWVRPLLEAYRDQQSELVRSEISNLLSSMKISAAGDVFADALDDPDFSGTEPDIISFMWNCGFLPEESLLRVVTCAVDGDFRCALEGLTWIEELESVHDENPLLDAILLVRSALEESDGEEKKELLQAILQALLKLESQQ